MCACISIMILQIILVKYVFKCLSSLFIFQLTSRRARIHVFTLLLLMCDDIASYHLNPAEKLGMEHGIPGLSLFRSR